jgi:NADPH-dependent F420 reductase
MLAFLGGTGPEGKGLALRLAMAGEEAIIGSRDPERAATAAKELADTASGAKIGGASNLDAASQADVVFLTVPYEAQQALLEPLQGPLSGKVVVNVIAPMRFERGRGAIAVEVESGSAAQESQQLLPNAQESQQLLPNAQVVAAFQNVSAEELQEPGKTMSGDVVVCSDHQEAKAQVMDLVRKIPDLRPVDGGGLANAKYVEQITPLLVNINRIYRVHSGIQIVGI